MNETRTHTVLVVEDDEMNREILEEMLSEYYFVITAKDGLEALDFIKYLERSENLHLIISDLRMPKMSGIELLEQAKHIVPHAKRILLTGCTDTSVMIEAVNRAHVYKYIEKLI